MLSFDLRRILQRHVPCSYASLIERMKFFIEPEVSCSRFFAEACFVPASLLAYGESGVRSFLLRTELGDFLAKRLSDAIFIDIPCGLHSVRETARDYDLIPLAHSLGIAAYIEVDLMADVLHDRLSNTIDVLENGTYELSKKIGDIGLREESGVSVMTMQDDLLGFVSKLPDAESHPSLVIYISALQPDAAFCKDYANQRDIVVPYLTELYNELARICGKEDTLILNSSAMLTAGLDDKTFPEVDATVALFQRGFTLVRRCAYGKVHVYAKSKGSYLSSDSALRSEKV